MLSLAAALDEPSAGEVRAGDASLSRLNEDGLARYRARHVALIFQNGNLWSGLSARENVALSLRLPPPEDPNSAALDPLPAFRPKPPARPPGAAPSGAAQRPAAIAP